MRFKTASEIYWILISLKAYGGRPLFPSMHFGSDVDKTMTCIFLICEKGIGLSTAQNRWHLWKGKNKLKGGRNNSVYSYYKY